MRILFVNQYYWPDLASTGQHLTDLAESLVARGHQVRVLCSRGGYLDGRGDAPAREVHRGVEIRRLAGSPFGQRRGFFARVADYAAFHAGVLPRVVFSRWADVVVTLTTPPLVGVYGALAARVQRRRGLRHVAWFMDLHPEAEFALGLLQPGSPLGRLLARLAALETRSVDRAVVLGPYQGARVVARGLDPARCVEIPVWSSRDEVTPRAHRDNALRTEYGWQDRFVVLYSGNAGLVHRFGELLDAAEEVGRRDPSVLFAFVGGGPRRREIEAEAARRGLANVEFRGYVPRELLGQSLPAADVHFVSLEPNQTGVAVPGKLYGILAAGRPVLFVGAKRCESADAVRDCRAGFTFEPGQGAQLAAAILDLRMDRELRERLGANARRAFLERFERGVACAQWAELLEGLNQPEGRSRGAGEVLRMPRERRQRTLDRVAAPLPAGSPAERADRVRGT